MRENIALSKTNKKPVHIFNFFREWDYGLYAYNAATARIIQMVYCENYHGNCEVIFIPKSMGDAWSQPGGADAK